MDEKYCERLCPLLKGTSDFSALMRRNEQKAVEMTTAVASKHDPLPKFCHRVFPLGNKPKERNKEGNLATHRSSLTRGKCQCDVPGADAL